MGFFNRMFRSFDGDSIDTAARMEEACSNSFTPDDGSRSSCISDDSCQSGLDASMSNDDSWSSASDDTWSSSLNDDSWTSSSNDSWSTDSDDI